MVSPVPPPAPLDLPEPPSPHPVSQPSPSRSPLRNEITLDPVTGTPSQDGSPDLVDDNDPWGTSGRDRMSHSPSPSIPNFASSFAQRVGSLVTTVSPGSQPGYLPTEAELEAEAELQRENSRREAERIITQEAMERKKVEDRVLEMLEGSRARPIRSQTTPSPGGPPGQSPTDKGGGSGWWSAAKNRLTPTKELTPAQQIVLDTKAREKEKRKSKDKEWPSNGKSKYQDPTYQSLSLPPGARPPGGMVGGGANVIPGSPASPSPHSNRPANQLMGSPSPSPSRSPDHSSIRSPSNFVVGSTNMPQPGTSPALSAASSRDPPPLYAQFSSEGGLDVPATLLTIARRFEKLERWAVGHVRALEERMSDVEKWLVDKERERERDSASSKTSLGTKSDASARTEEIISQPKQQVVTVERQRVEVDTEVKREVSEMKDELGELRGRVGELGREMARLASNSSSAVSHSVSPSEASGFGIGRIVSPETTDPNTPVMPSPRTLPSIPVDHDQPQSPSTHSIEQSETASIISTSTATRTKLPYPTGDYTSPSPPSSPRPSASQNVGNYTANNASSNISRTRPMSYSGLPIPPTNFLSSVALPRSSGIDDFASGSPALPPPPSTRPISTSPGPRKRYTVALGQPLSSSPSTSSAAPTSVAGEPPTLDVIETKVDFGEGLFSEPQPLELQTAFFSRVPGESEVEDEEKQRQPEEEIIKDEDKSSEGTLHRQETIGKTPITLSRLSLSPPPSQNSSPSDASRNTTGLQHSSPRSSPSNPRIRAQSTYGVPGSSASSISSLSRHERTPAFGSITPSPSGRDVDDGKGSWKTRSRSIDRIGLGIDAGQGVGNFVDPLVIRKKEREKERGVSTAATRGPIVGSPGGPRGRVAFGDLLAFFDAEKQ
ncbi:hypothetical protein JB92DRAFT_2919367 [Gautieria morchelliformis]|nr:hypothetical protein JB92DRAFT_2919367 [Gautieria morchelliformis]